MGFLKSLFGGFSASVNNGAQRQPLKKERTYPVPNYSLYVSIGENDDVYIVSLNDRIQKKFPFLVKQYNYARMNYYNVHNSGQKDADYRVPFNNLNQVFEFVVKWFCSKASLPVQDKSITELATSLKTIGFNNEQMNVIYGTLYMIDKYEEPLLKVTEYDIKVHFISLGVILKIFKEKFKGNGTNNVPCSFETMREAEAKKQNTKQQNEQGHDQQEIKRIEKEYNKAKNLNRNNQPEDALKALDNAVKMAAKHLCKVNNIKMPKDEAIEQLLDILLQLGIVNEKYVEFSKGTVKKAAKCANGAAVSKDSVKALIQRVGSSVIPALKKPCAEKPEEESSGTINKIPSFKSIEERSAFEEFDIKTEYPKLFEYIKTAKERFDEGKYEDALQSVRKALEMVMNTLGKKYNIRFEKDDELLQKIDLITSAANLSEKHKEIMHNARKLGNSGSHYDDTKEVGANDAKEGITLIEQITEVFKSIMSENRGNKNTPMIDPDYYLPSRRYYGSWCDCFTAQDLLLNMEYVKLKRKVDEGDPGAALDIASGFLQRKIEWERGSLICAPKSNQYVLSPDNYDPRYYFWILIADILAYKNWMEGKVIPLRYIATALVEGIKFMVYHKAAEKYPLRETRQPTQYRYVRSMFGGDLLSGEAVITGLANMLISMSDEYKIEGKEGSIVSPLHCDITVDKIRRYVYFYHFLCNENQTVNLNVRLLRSKDDKGKTYREIISNNKEFEDLINIILYNKASNLNERYEEAKRKIEESSRRYRNTHGY